MPLRRQRFGRSGGPMEKREDFSKGPAVLLDHAKFYSFFDLEREKKAVPFSEAKPENEKIFQEFFKIY